jgi:hypothetical protein
MMRLRIIIAAVVAGLTFGLTAGAASGATASKRATVAPLYKLPIHGVARNDKQFTGTYGIQRFVVRGGEVWSTGVLKGRLDGRRVTRRGVMMPADLTAGGGARAAQAGCPILHLVLGPIDLNLLGLRVRLGGGPLANREIVLDITAIPGGGLLGDLLCGLANLLDGPGVLDQLRENLEEFAAVLNSIIALLGRGT